MLLFKRHQTLFSLTFPFFSAFNVPSFESFMKSKFQNQIPSEKARLCRSIARKLQSLLPDGCITLFLSFPCAFPQPQSAAGQENAREMHTSTSPYEQTYQPESTTSLLPYCITLKQFPLGHPIVTSVFTLWGTDALGASKINSQTLVSSFSFYL